MVGRSGSGKSTMADILSDKHNFRVVQSYTTRPKRTENERGHIFLSHEEYEKFSKDSICCYKLIENEHYFCTFDQINSCDLYIVDPISAFDFYQDFKDKYNIVIIYLKISEYSSILRMIDRNDHEAKIISRIEQDKILFNDDIINKINNLEYCHSIDAKQSVFNVLNDIKQIIDSHRK